MKLSNLKLAPKVSAYQATQETLAGLKQATGDHPGQLVGERFQHRGWVPEMVRAFMAAPVIKLPAGELRKRLYP